MHNLPVFYKIFILTLQKREIKDNSGKGEIHTVGYINKENTMETKH